MDYTEKEKYYIHLKVNHPELFKKEHKKLFSEDEISDFANNEELQRHVVESIIKKEEKELEAKRTKEDVFSHLLHKALARLDQILDLPFNAENNAMIFNAIKTVGAKNISYMTSYAKAQGEKDGAQANGGPDKRIVINLEKL